MNIYLKGSIRRYTPPVVQTIHLHGTKLEAENVCFLTEKHLFLVTDFRYRKTEHHDKLDVYTFPTRLQAYMPKYLEGEKARCHKIHPKTKKTFFNFQSPNSP